MSAINILTDICYSPEHNLSFDIYLPENTDTFPLVVFFHGGGLECGDKSEISALGHEFAEAGIAFAAPNYRMYPDAEYPDFIVDSACAAAFIFEHTKGAGRLFIGGHSAGAYLAMMLCFDRSYLTNVGFGPDSVGGYILCSGQPTAHFNVLRERGIDTRSVIIDESAPIFHITEHGAPVQIFCADGDMENRLEQTELLVSTLRHFRYSSPVDYRVMKGHDHGSYTEKTTQNSPLLCAVREFIFSCM